MNNKIEIILVTGFLGSGKTTLLYRFLNYYENKKTAFIINDFGKIAVDGTLLKENNNNNLSMYEISNGSIFCSCLSHKLIETLKYLSKQNLDLLIIETSGLSDPSSFYKILEENQLLNYYKVKHTICVLDGSTVLKYYDSLTVIRKQIKACNFVLINKSDLITKSTMINVVNLIFKINIDCKVFRTINTNFELYLLDNSESNFNDIKENMCINSKDSVFKIYFEQENVPLTNIINFLKENVNNVLRVKGFLKESDNINYVSDNSGKIIVRKMNNVELKKIGISILLKEENKDLLNNELLKLTKN